MLVSCLKILLILVIAQYVTSVEFYKSKRVPPKYKEIRRTYSLKSKEENVESKVAETFIEKNVDRGISIGDTEITDDKQSSLTTSTIINNGDTIDFSLKNNDEKAKTEPVEVDININSDQDRDPIDNVESTEDKQPSFTTTVKPKRRPFNIRKISKPSVIDIDGSDDKDKVPIEKTQTTNKKQPSFTISTIATKRRDFNLRPLRNKEEKAQNKPVETLAIENIDGVKESINDEQITEERKPGITTATTQPNRRFSNLRPLKNRVEKVQSIAANVNADQVVVFNSNLQKNAEEIPVTITRKIKPLRRNLNVYSLNRKEEKTENKLVSSGNIQTTEDKKVIITTSTVKSKIPPTLSIKRTLKKTKQEVANKFGETKVSENTHQDKLYDSDIQIIGDKESTTVTSTEIPTTPISSVYSLQMEKENTDDESVEVLVKENVRQNEMADDDIQIIRDKNPTISTSTLKPKTLTLSPQALKHKEENNYSESVAIKVNENTDQIKVSLGNVKVVEDSAAVSSPHSLKKETENESVEKLLNENTDEIGISLGKVKITADEKSSLSSSSITLNSRTSVSRPHSLNKETDSESVETLVKEDTGEIKVSLDNFKITEENKLSHSSNKNINGASVETIVNKNTGQNKVVNGNVQDNGENKVTIIANTIKPRRRTLNRSSLKTQEENFKSKSTTTLKTDQVPGTTSNVGATGNKKLRVTTTSVKPKTSTSILNSRNKETDSESVKTLVNESTDSIKVSLGALQITGKNKFNHSLNKDINDASVEAIVNENTDQNKVSISNIQATGENKVTITTSTIKPRRPTVSRYSLKRQEENVDSKSIVTVKTDVTTSNVRATGDKTLRVTTSTVNPSSYVSRPRSLKKETNSESVATIVNDNTGQIKVSLGTLKITEENKRGHSLNKNINGASVETRNERTNENTDQNKGSISNAQATRENKFTVIAGSVNPSIQTLNLYSLKGKEENKPVATPVNEKRDRYQVTTSNIRATQDKKLSVNSSITTPQRRTSNLNSLNKKKENTSSKPVEALVNENTHQEQASTGNIQTSRESNFYLISSTIKPKRLMLNLDSLKINEDNTERKTIDTFISRNFDHEKVKTNEETSSHISTEEPKILTANSAISEHGSQRIIKTQRKILVQNTQLDAESKTSTVGRVSNKDRDMKVAVTQAPKSYESYYQTTIPYRQLEKTTQKHGNFVPIVGVENYVYAYNGDYHYSYEGGDGTKAFERGELKSADGSYNTSGVVGGYSYKDKDGNDFSLSYTAGEGGYQPVGAHLPTPPPIPPAIQRVLRILATKTTPEPITERIYSHH